jgi:hypothetical protein
MIPPGLFMDIMQEFKRDILLYRHTNDNSYYKSLNKIQFEIQLRTSLIAFLSLSSTKFTLI